MVQEWTSGVDLGYGDTAAMVYNRAFDPGLFRPFWETDRRSPRYGQRCVVINSDRMVYNKAGELIRQRRKVTLDEAVRLGYQIPLVANATATRKEQWIAYDRAIVRATRYRLSAFADLAKTPGCIFGGFDGFGKMVLEHETMSDPGEAIQDMDGLSEGRTDNPLWQLQATPLPITHADFNWSYRRLYGSQSSNSPLDIVSAEAGGRRIGETLERVLIGTATGLTYGANPNSPSYGLNPTNYGYLNYPLRITKTNMTVPNKGAGWTPDQTLTDVENCLYLLRAAKHYGPFNIYTSTDWDTPMDGDYGYIVTSGGLAPTQSLRDRIKKLPGVADCKRLDFLPGTAPNPALGPGQYNVVGGGGGTGCWPYTMIFVEMQPDVAQIANGMDIVALMWQVKGGMEICLRIMTIQATRIRADYYGNCGVLVATTA